MIDTLTMQESTMEVISAANRLRTLPTLFISESADQIHQDFVIGQTSVVGDGGHHGSKKTMDAKVLFFLGLLLAASGLYLLLWHSLEESRTAFRSIIRYGGKLVRLRSYCCKSLSSCSAMGFYASGSFCSRVINSDEPDQPVRIISEELR